jgi:hypothetical protein
MNPFPLEPLQSCDSASGIDLPSHLTRLRPSSRQINHMPQEHLSSKWHGMKDRFKYLFAPKHHHDIETWYNHVALHRQRDMFREVVKALHLHEPQPKNPSVETHRAAHMLTLYGVLFTEKGREKALSWLSTGTSKQLEIFREVFSAAQAVLQPVSVTKEQFVYRDPGESVDKTAHRKKIDWESSKTAEFVRTHHNNPMDTHSHLPSDEKGKPQRQSKFVDRGTAAAQSIMKLLKVSAEDLERLKKERSTELDNFYAVEPDGSTVFRTKAARGSRENHSSRVINTFTGNSATDWRTTNREQHGNPGPVKAERVIAEEHPAIALVTASLGFCLPSLSPKRQH